MANCLAEGSSLKSLWLDDFEKLFVLRNVSDLYIFVYGEKKFYPDCEPGFSSLLKPLC